MRTSDPAGVGECLRAFDWPLNDVGCKRLQGAKMGVGGWSKLCSFRFQNGVGPSVG